MMGLYCIIKSGTFKIACFELTLMFVEYYQIGQKVVSFFFSSNFRFRFTSLLFAYLHILLENIRSPPFACCISIER